jgi:uncharacterized protein (DUF1800 family)
MHEALERQTTGQTVTAEPALVDPVVPAAAETPITAGPTRPDRRQLFVGTGAVILAAAATQLAAPQPATAQETAPSPALRSPRNTVQAAAGEPPALPPLAIIALNRMGFGPRPGDIAAFNALGDTPQKALEAYVDQQLNPGAIDDSACDARIATYPYQTLGKSLAQLWSDHVRKAGIPWEERILPMRETEQVTFLRAIYSKRQLVEVLADHWHNHFNVYGRDYWTAPVWVHYDRDVIRAHLLGNFRTMVQAVAQSPAMLYYLDNQSNSGGNPNENYARELFELHTLGAENYFGVKPLTVGPDGGFVHPAPKDENGRPLLYIDEDVYGATTCFTGWRVNGDTGAFTFDASAHFPYQKIVLGQAIPAAQGIEDGHDVLDLLACHPGTARYICRKLCRRLVSDHPPESLVEAAAAVFLANLDAPDQLKRVVRTILLSEEFSTIWGEKIKRPFEYAVSLLRAAEADFAPDDGNFRWMYYQTGQELFSWNPPNGYPDFKEPWSGTMPLLQRWRLCNWLIEWKYGGEGANKEDRRLPFPHPANVNTPATCVDHWARRLLGQRLPDHERIPIVDFMAQGRQADYTMPADEIADRLRHMIALIFMSPSFQWR